MPRFPPADAYTEDFIKYHAPNRVVKGTGLKSFNVYENMVRNEEIIPYFSKRNEKVLDMGCGRAANTVRLALAGKDVTALDLDKVELEQAKSWISLRNLGKNVKLVRGNMNRMPFGSREFDAILCAEALEHVRDMEVAGKELVRVLKDDGYAVITLPNASSLMWGIIHFFTAAKLYSCPPIKDGRDFHHELPISEIEKLIEKIGLEIVERKAVNVFPVQMAYNFLPEFLTPVLLFVSYYTRKFDCWLGRRPFFRNHGGSVILKCRKGPKNER